MEVKDERKAASDYNKSVNKLLKMGLKSEAKKVKDIMKDEKRHARILRGIRAVVGKKKARS